MLERRSWEAKVSLLFDSRNDVLTLLIAPFRPHALLKALDLLARIVSDDKSRNLLLCHHRIVLPWLLNESETTAGGLTQPVMELVRTLFHLLISLLTLISRLQHLLDDMILLCISQTPFGKINMSTAHLALKGKPSPRTSKFSLQSSRLVHIVGLKE